MAEQEKPYIGGQAVIEGVMMRSRTCLSVAVRRPDGQIIVREGPVVSKLATSKLWKLPGLRGVATLVESLSLGYSALSFSAEQQLTDDEAKRQGKGGSIAAMLAVLGFSVGMSGEVAPSGKPADAGSGAKLATALSIVFAIGLFIALPQLLTAGASKLFGWTLSVQDSGFHVVTGAFKLLVFTLYLTLISRIPEVRRVFQYHGAEHKTIFAYEQGLPLTVDNVRAQSTLHPRCGTTFMIVVIVISVIVGAIATPLLLPNVSGVLGQVLTLALRIALLPVIAGISYELQRLSARYCTTGPLRALLLPGFAFQKITTREPDDRQIEIAITAMQTAIWRDHVGVDVPADAPLLFASFEAFNGALPSLREAA